MTPRQLKYFVEIARAGSITTAASTLHIAQPALSHHVAAMEEEVGAPLFMRHARGVELTDEGRRLLDRATSILRQIDRIKDDVRGSASEARGNVSLCLVGSVAPVLAVPLFRALRERAPAVQLQLSTGMSREARALVEARRVDLALLPIASEISRLEAIPLFEERFYLFGATHNWGTESGPIRFADIGDRPLVAPDREHDLRKLIERTALSLGCSLNVRYELNNPELYRDMVSEGLACAVMPRNALAAPASAGVVAREITEPAIERTQSLVWMVDHPLSPAGEAVRSALVEVVGTLIDEGTLLARKLT